MSLNPPTEPSSAAIEAPKRRPLWFRIFVRLAFAIAVAITLLTVLIVEENLRGSITWNRYRKDAEAQGKKLQLADFIPPMIPNERNFAAIPIFQNAFKEPTPPDPLRLSDRYEIKAPGLTGSHAGEKPIDLAAWQKYFFDSKILPAAGESPAADVLKVLERYQPQLDQLRLAGSRPECRFPIPYEKGAAAPLPHLSILQNAGRIYALRLGAHLALGQSHAALDDFAGGLRLYTATMHEPTVISGLVRLSNLSMTEGAVWSGLVRHQWDAGDLEKIAAAYSDIRLFDDFTLVLSSERGFDNQLYDQLAQMNREKFGSMIRMFETTSLTPPPNPWQVRMSLLFYPSGWLRLSQARTNRYLDQVTGLTSQTPPRVYLDRLTIDQEVEKNNAGPIEQMQYFLYYLGIPVMEQITGSYAYGQTLLDQTRLGCAVERYRLTHDKLPESLDLLAPNFIPAIPRDVMTGDPLHYQPQPDGSYSIYSVGWNRRDDGGKNDPAITSSKKQPDWVWTVAGK